jgi:hypothetical protein
MVDEGRTRPSAATETVIRRFCHQELADAIIAALGEPQPVREPTDDEVLGLIYKHFPERVWKALTFTRTKDSIDVEYPTFNVTLFAKALVALALSRPQKK